MLHLLFNLAVTKSSEVAKKKLPLQSTVVLPTQDYQESKIAEIKEDPLLS